MKNFFILFVFVCVVGISFYAVSSAPAKSVASDKAEPAGNPVFDNCWLIRDSSTKAPESVVVFYKKASDGLVYGRMLVLFDDKSGKITDTILKPVERSKGIDGAPFLCGLDFITALSPSENGRMKGVVVDPDTGLSFKCYVWYASDKNKIAVRGEVLGFGKTEYWEPYERKNLPFKFDVSKF